MRILFVSRSFVPASGAPTELRYLTAILAKKGHEVHVYTSNAFNTRENLFPETRVEDVDGVKVHYFNRIWSMRKFLITPEMFRALRRECGSFDVVAIWGFRSAQSTAAALAAHRAGVPYVLTGRAGIPYSEGNKLYKKFFDRVLGTRILANASRLLAFNEIERQHFLQLGARDEQIEIIPLGINPDDFENLPAPGAMRKRYGLEGKRVALFLARFSIIKGIYMLLPAFARALKEAPNLHLCMAGSDDGYLAKTEELIDQLDLRGHVTMLGYVTGEEKLQALVDCDFVVLSSSYDLFPNVLCEAWGCGKPVIITQGCGMAAMVEQEEIGLVTPFDEAAYGAAIARFAVDPELVTQIGCRGREYTHKELNSWTIADRHEALYESLSKQRKMALASS